MPRRVRLLLPLLLIAALGACLNDPFGMEPEVRGVKIPEKAAPADTATPDAGETPAEDPAA